MNTKLTKEQQETMYNFQIQEIGVSWENTKAKTLSFETRKNAIDFAYNLSYILEKEIRVTQGNYLTASGTYIRF